MKEMDCPECGQTLEIDSSLYGKKVGCPACNKTITVHTPKQTITVPRSGAHPAGTRLKYQVHVIKEGALGTILLGSAKIPADKVENHLNAQGAKGWALDFMIVEQRRMFLFWKREAVIITMSQPY